MPRTGYGFVDTDSKHGKGIGEQRNASSAHTAIIGGKKEKKRGSMYNKRYTPPAAKQPTALRANACAQAGSRCAEDAARPVPVAATSAALRSGAFA